MSGIIGGCIIVGCTGTGIAGRGGCTAGAGFFGSGFWGSGADCRAWGGGLALASIWAANSGFVLAISDRE